MLLEYSIAAVLIAAIIYAIAKTVTTDRYSKMTEKEFEAEAQRGSRMGSAIATVQKIIDPSHHVEHVEEQKQRLEADASESGDKPNSGTPHSQPE